MNPACDGDLLDQDGKEKSHHGALLNLGLPHPPLAAALPPLAGAHICEGADLGSPAFSPQEEFNQYLPTVKEYPATQSFRVKRKKRVNLAAVLPAVPGGAASSQRSSPVAGALTGRLCSLPHAWLPSANTESILCTGTRAHSEGS